MAKKIKIWHDKWLPIQTTNRVESQVKVLDNEARVSEIIEEVTRQWKEDLVQEIF